MAVSYQNKGCGDGHGRVKGFPHRRGRGNHPPRGGGHQISFCKTQSKEKSDVENENFLKIREITRLIPRAKIEKALVKSRLPTARGTVN